MFSLVAALAAAIALYPGLVGAQKTRLPGKVVDIRAGEYFIISPDSIPAGLVTIRLTQTGDVTRPWPADMDKLRADLTYHFHMVWVVRLDSGKTAADLLRAEHDRAPTPWATILGGPGFADTPGSSNVTMIIPQGNYAFVCYVGSAREDRNRYHLLKGMIRPLRVTGKSTAARLPVPHLRVVVRNDSTLMSDTLNAGVHTLLVRNTGKRPADFAINRVKPGFTLEQARAWRPRMMTEPPRRAVGGVVWVAPDRELLTTVVLEPGDYFFGDKHVIVRR